MVNRCRYLYLIQSEEEGYYKIGISYSPNIRIKQLNTGNSSELKIICVYQSEYASEIEKTLHRRYSHLRKNGEWFKLTLKEEQSFPTDCRKIEDNLILLDSYKFNVI